MNTCPTEKELSDYREHKVSKDEFLRINRHIVNCPACRQAFTTISRASATVLAADMLYHPSSDCPSEELLNAYVRGRIGWIARYRVRKHLSECWECQELVSGYLHDNCDSGRQTECNP